MVSKAVYEEAEQILAQRRQNAVSRAAELRERMEKDERVRAAEETMASSMHKIAAAIRAKEGFEQTFAEVRAENERAQAELARLLKEAGETATDFEPVYSCPNCRDTGYRDGKMCACLRSLLNSLSAREFCRTTGMQLKTFEEIDLSVYDDTFDETLDCSERDWMTDMLRETQKYARNFSLSSRSLLFYGPTGTGKTHYSLAIASEVLRRGFSVAYGPVSELLRRMEREHFGKEDGDTEQALLDCDLLILDDLGAEFSSPFALSAVYNTLNSRMLSGRPVIISTNLTPRGIKERYGNAVISRIMGTYAALEFVGSDIRQILMKRRNAED